MSLLPLLLGESPGPGGGTGDPLGRRTARRLCDFAGWMPEFDGEDPFRAALAKRFELRNLLDFSPGKTGKGSRFPMPEARRAAEGLGVAESGRTVVCLGKRVAQALSVPPVYFRWEEVKGMQTIVVPHPSPINLRLNEPDMRRRTGEVLREAAG